MHTVIEYTNYRKEIGIQIHGYFDNYESALIYSKKQINNSATISDNVITAIHGVDCTIDIQQHVNMYKHILSNIKIELCLIESNKIDKTDYDEIKESIFNSHYSDETTVSIDAFFNAVSDNNMLHKLFKIQYPNINTSSMVQDYNDEIYNIFHQMDINHIYKLIQNGILEADRIEVSSQMFAIVEMYSGGV